MEKNLFTKNLTKSNKDIKDTRAERIAKAAEKAQRAIIDNLEEEVDKIESTIEDLEDLSPDTALSLLPVKGEFKADEWAQTLQLNKIQLANKKLELEIARKTYAYYFSTTK